MDEINERFVHGLYTLLMFVVTHEGINRYDGEDPLDTMAEKKKLDW
jgi:hypothetical protein